MKKLSLLLFILLSFSNFAQVKLNAKDLKNLIAISEIYSKNTNATGSEFAKSIDSLRTSVLNPIADALIEVGKGEETILSHKFLARPSNEQLYLWYVIREIHYNRVSETRTKKPNVEIANEVLSQKIDERWLLDNYYYRIHGGIASLFNKADLSKINIDIEKLGFKNQTEKSIFYLNMMDALIGGRFKVLQMLKKNDKIIEFSEKLPMFNGKKYFYYTNLDFEDFNWVGYEENRSYSEVNIGNLYNILIAQYIATVQLKDKAEAQEIYMNSILHEPKYFKYSAAKGELQMLFDKKS
ncbi:hypothetical protein [Flavobacterium pectinovorum]|uniref:Uncharacterized protein n=1 Tax=Flavobacterium pectinovorum TaxID=29533 RepID=A0A502F4R3_9FLAO|nr:hypothetical protein [Flavobacterium pectinovorum]TPG45125.1 hypothetical protein EAH81_00540 [Flavobacterium pectinovorum]